MTADLCDRIARVKASIADSARSAGRSGEVTLVAVTKTIDVGRILEAVSCGQRVFGENRVQEAAQKIASVRDVAPDTEWHLIGHLQTNKARAAVHSFSLIESVDSVRLAGELNRRAADAEHVLSVLLEVNVAEEASKGGFPPDDLEREAGAILVLPYLSVRGLMTVAPLTEDPEDVRWVFRRLRELRDLLREQYGHADLTELSMGMSGDYRVAVEEGATIVRIGRALFGERPAVRRAGQP